MVGKGGARYAGLTALGPAGVQWTGEVRVRAELFTWPLLQRAPRRILVASMSDLFHEKLELETLDALHAVMAIAHWHRFLVLTKRADRMRTYYADPQTPRRIIKMADRLAAELSRSPGSSPRTAWGEAAATSAAARPRGGVRQLWATGLARLGCRAADPPAADLPTGQSRPVGPELWPLPNLWAGVSVEDQPRSTRIAELLQTPAALRWVAFEPLLGLVRPDAVPVDHGYVDALSGELYLLDGRGRRSAVGGEAWPALDWVLAGGETGAGARASDPEWVRELRDQCVAAGVPFWFKQWGEWAPAPQDGFGRRMVRFGRRASGHLVDGRRWNELPTAMQNGRASRRRR
jgi:protein gp37